MSSGDFCWQQLPSTATNCHILWLKKRQISNKFIKIFINLWLLW